MRIFDRFDVRDVDIFLGSELFERSGNSRMHVVPALDYAGIRKKNHRYRLT